MFESRSYIINRFVPTSSYYNKRRDTTCDVITFTGEVMFDNQLKVWKIFLQSISKRAFVSGLNFFQLECPSVFLCLLFNTVRKMKQRKKKTIG